MLFVSVMVLVYFVKSEKLQGSMELLVWSLFRTCGGRSFEILDVVKRSLEKKY
eukprot:TRINITY_DN12299_c0_g1_i1.p4 TRINITY_DN12299_c0_g1~~TRINITY_DN12299_c0_g1_i1.p4  ORF type:complete len:53 (+),score=1.41 TRINITY_DN12299_c0_g1_i1:105-263(+)